MFIPFLVATSLTSINWSPILLCSWSTPTNLLTFHVWLVRTSFTSVVWVCLSHRTRANCNESMHNCLRYEALAKKWSYFLFKNVILKNNIYFSPFQLFLIHNLSTFPLVLLAQLRPMLSQPIIPPLFFQLINNSPKDLIYFSFGSITSTKHLPPRFMRHLIHTFEQFKDYQFIVKVDKDDQVSWANWVGFLTVFLFQETPKLLTNNSTTNVHFLSWAPQREILALPKTKLFISHAGYGSVLEAAYAVGL